MYGQAQLSPRSECEDAVVWIGVQGKGICIHRSKRKGHTQGYVVVLRAKAHVVKLRTECMVCSLVLCFKSFELHLKKMTKDKTLYFRGFASSSRTSHGGQNFRSPVLGGRAGRIRGGWAEVACAQILWRILCYVLSFGARS